MIEFHGLDEFKDALAEVKKNYPDKAEDLLVKMGVRLKRKVIEKTPEGTESKKQLEKKEQIKAAGGKPRRSKHLKNSYRLGKIKQAGGTLYIEFNSESPHFHLIERGHRIVSPNGKELGFTPGAFMLEKSVQEVEEEKPAEVEALINSIFGELE